MSWLLLLPLGKFFHIVERPATRGVTLYQTISRDAERRDPAEGGRCARCRTELPAMQFIADLKGTLRDLGQRYALGDGLGELRDYCPSCKCVLRGQAYYEMTGRQFV